MKNKCKHKWIKDQPDFITLVSGTPKDLGEEVRMKCTVCGKVEYRRVKDWGSIVDIAKEVE